MKAKKLPSGNWRCRVYDYTDSQGKKHYKSYTASSKKEAELLALTNVPKIKSELNLIEAIDNYCEAKSNVMSPSTIRSYLTYKHILEPIGYQNIVKIDSTMLQGYINDIARVKSPKYCKNIYSLIKTVLEYNGCRLDGKVTLPARQKPTYSLPSEYNFKKVLEYARETDTELYKAICLGGIGMMRRSEISALTADDIQGNRIHIHKAMVLDADNTWNVKTTKTYSSDRYITMPQEIIDVFPKEGRIVKLNPAMITKRFQRMLEKFDFPRFRFHDCRHFGATLMHSIGIPDQYIMLQGGWSNDAILQAVYRNTLPDYQKTFEERAENQFKKLLN